MRTWEVNDRKFIGVLSECVWEFGGWKEKIGKPNKRNVRPTEEARKWTVVLITLIDGNLCSPKKTSRDNYYSLSRRCVLSFSSCFFLLFFIYSVLVARAAVTRFPFAHTHTIYPSIYPFHLPSFTFSRNTPTITFFIHRRASVFAPLFSFLIVSFVLSLSNLWLYEYIYSTIGWYSLRYSGRVSGEFWCSRLTASVSMMVCRRWRWRWRWYR